jgi:methylthioribose-1-phosphate isomerase
MLKSIAWTGSAVRLLDQTQLPSKTEFIDVTTVPQMHDCIRRLVVRGAPAIGVSASFGAYLAVHRFDGSVDDAKRVAVDAANYLATSRPTAVNLFWALDLMKRIVTQSRATSVDLLRQEMLAECHRLYDEDAARCRRIGELGLEWLLAFAPKDRPIRVLTHCNAGALATVAYGTALAPIYVGTERGVKFEVFSDETRPLFQGSRITATELAGAGIPVTVLCDSMAASLMREKQIDVVFVGADRIAANGDTANKVGTFPLALVARHFNVPFVVLAPTSTIDVTLPDGSGIPIEHRDAREVTQPMGLTLAPAGVGVYNPAFDVTPASLITAIVTEQRVATLPTTFA